MLRKGDKGKDVEILQHLLGNRGYFNGVADGIFGDETERAVKAFQLANGLDDDGVVGPSTNEALAKDPSGFTEYLLRRGDKGESVRRLQRALIKAGYSIGSSGVDGDFGGGTEKAVKAFQKDNNLDQDGIVGPNTWKALSDPAEMRGKPRYLRLGSTGDDVNILQHLLNNRGYDCGVADGIFGETTERAVKAFQRANGLKDDGVVGPSTNEALAKDPSGFTKYTLRNGDAGENVKRLQRALVAAGYNIGSSGVDGYFGGGTERAVRKFQSDNGLDDDGIVGPNTWNVLDNVGSSNQLTRILRLGSTGWDVKILQHLLNNRGYDCGVADGIFGGGTERAVKAFQRANGLDDDGVVGPSTNEALSKDPSGFTKYTLRIGDKGESVKQLQQILINAGYSVGSSGVDGDFGGGTENAVKSFQRANGLDDDGIVGANTWKALEGVKGSGTYSGTLRLGSSGRGVVILQELLNEKGYDCGKADGIFGGGTERAVKAFQRANGLDDDGIVGPNTWDALHGGFNSQYAGGEGVEKFLNVAISQLGYHEQWENMTKYGAWYGMNGNPWCSMFVSWCANRAGILYSVVPKYHYAGSAVNWYRNRNRYGRRGKYIPKPGDIFFLYNKDKTDGPFYHTGIVEYVEGNTLHTVEGNANDAVRRITRSLSDWTIHGYGINGGISYKKDLEQEELDKINDHELSKKLGVSFGKTEKKKVIFENSFMEVSYQRSANINIGSGSEFSFSLNEKGRLEGGGIATGIINLMLKLGTDGSTRLEQALKTFYGISFSILVPAADGNLGITLKTVGKINDNYSIALLLNIEFKVSIDEIEKKIEEIAKEVSEDSPILLVLLLIGIIVLEVFSGGIATLVLAKIVEVISIILGVVEAQ